MQFSCAFCDCIATSSLLTISAPLPLVSFDLFCVATDDIIALRAVDVNSGPLRAGNVHRFNSDKRLLANRTTGGYKTDWSRKLRSRVVLWTHWSCFNPAVKTSHYSVTLLQLRLSSWTVNNYDWWFESACNGGENAIQLSILYYTILYYIITHTYIYNYLFRDSK